MPLTELTRSFTIATNIPDPLAWLGAIPSAGTALNNSNDFGATNFDWTDFDFGNMTGNNLDFGTGMNGDGTNFSTNFGAFHFSM